jgi:outer membrane protein OmpA-like peptidoglycan-associated protein
MLKLSIIISISIFLSAGSLFPQFDVLKKVKKKVENKVEEKIDKGLDDATKEEKKENTKKESTKKEQKEESIEAEETEVNKEEQAGLKSFSKYDFVPGDKVLLFEDFSQDAVGDFPALWTTDVAGEINTVNIVPGNWFNLNSTEGTYWLMQDIDFPKNFILEMDIIPKKDGGRFAADVVLFGESSHSEMDKAGDPGICGLHVKIEKNVWETSGYKKGVNEKLSGSSVNNLVEPEKVNHVIVWVQNRRVRIYHKEGKVLDVPTNIYEGSKFSRLCFKLYRGASAGSYISNIKITTAAPDTRNKLLTEGKLVTYGIYFDVNKDIVKPESYGTLKDIATVLKEVPDVKVKIVGHTDSDGDNNSNLDLSQRRAASVKNALVKDFGIDASMLDTGGKGEGEPVAPNDNTTNKALNRRVEFIKL